VAVVAAAFAVVLAVAIPLRNTRDVRPDVTRMMETDARTAATFRAAAKKLALGQTSEKAMIDLIEREIIPALTTEKRSLMPRGVVPQDQKALAAGANEYLALRIESWRIRATAFRQGSLTMLRQADSKEGAARDVLARIPHLSPT
jgi:hypothetical protein